MELSDIVINWDESIHNTKEGTLIAVELKDIYQFDKNTKRFTDRIIGYTVVVVDCLNAFSKSSIRIETNERPSSKIQAGIDTKDYCSVFFHGLGGKVYKDFSSGEVRFSITAKSVEVLE